MRKYFPFMLMIFQLPLLMLMSIYMLMIQSCIIVIVTSDNWSAFYSVLLHNFLYGWSGADPGAGKGRGTNRLVGDSRFSC